MGKDQTKRCKVCGKEYELCVSCEKTHSWKVHTDNPEHYYIFITLMQYQTDHNAKSAYRALRKRGVDFNKTDEYLPSVQRLMAEIYAVVNENGRAKEITTNVELAVANTSENVEMSE